MSYGAGCAADDRRTLDERGATAAVTDECFRGGADEQARPGREHAGDADALALPARELMRKHHAGLAGDRRKSERLCRYAARPAIAVERLSRDGDGLVVHELKHPFHDAITHVQFEPMDLMASMVESCPRSRPSRCCWGVG